LPLVSNGGASRAAGVWVNPRSPARSNGRASLLPAAAWIDPRLGGGARSPRRLQEAAHQARGGHM
jgi:hypothetical protein